MKLPINPLLHLISLGAVGGMVMAGLQLQENAKAYDSHRGQVKKDVDSLYGKSKNGRKGSGGWNYRNSASQTGQSDQPFWFQLKDANFTGKVKIDPKTVVEETQEEVKKTPGVIDLNDILHVIAIAHGNGLNGAVVKYTATVEVPEEFKRSTAAIAVRSIPAGRRKRSDAPRIPTQQVGSSPPHHMKVGDSLWPPYSHVFLHGIAQDASEVDFELRVHAKAEAEGEDKKNPIQTLLKNQLGLPAEILKSLVKAPSKGSEDGKSDKKGVETKDPADSYQWVDQAATFVDRSGNVNISKKDSRWLSRDGGQIFNEDVHMRDYSAGSGTHKVRGIQLRKLSSRVRQFGAQEGDVVISINNQPVKGMAAAKRLGRRLHNKGVRSFRIEILRRGERQFLSYHMNKDG
jgi:hypothetical protein